LFEELLGKAVENSGVKVKLDAQVKSVNPSRRKGMLRGGETFNYDILVLATGATAPLNTSVGLDRPKGLLPAVNAEYQLEHAIDSRYVHVYFDSRVAPGFFAWIVPLNEYKVRVGLGATSKPIERLKFFEKLDPFNINLAQARRLQVYSGLILTGGPLRKYYSGRVVVIGDSAGHTKPTTGGGIAFTSIAARLLAQVSALADTWDNVGSFFQARYNKVIQREVKFMLLARRLANSMDDVQISNLLDTVQRSGIVDEVAKSHMDFHGGALIALAKKSLETKPIVTVTTLLQALLRVFLLS
ncbi:MAG: tryptophan 7-halogenase, partial [Thermofilaceae archaeon]